MAVSLRTLFKAYWYYQFGKKEEMLKIADLNIFGWQVDIVRSVYEV